MSTRPKRTLFDCNLTLFSVRGPLDAILSPSFYRTYYAKQAGLIVHHIPALSVSVLCKGTLFLRLHLSFFRQMMHISGAMLHREDETDGIVERSILTGPSAAFSAPSSSYKHIHSFIWFLRTQKYLNRPWKRCPHVFIESQRPAKGVGYSSKAFKSTQRHRCTLWFMAAERNMPNLPCCEWRAQKDNILSAVDLPFFFGLLLSWLCWWTADSNAGDSKNFRHPEVPEKTAERLLSRVLC